MKAQVEPFPLVPLTWIMFNLSKSNGYKPVHLREKMQMKSRGYSYTPYFDVHDPYELLHPGNILVGVDIPFLPRLLDGLCVALKPVQRRDGVLEEPPVFDEHSNNQPHDRLT